MDASTITGILLGIIIVYFLWFILQKLGDIHTVLSSIYRDIDSTLKPEVWKSIEDRKAEDAREEAKERLNKKNHS